MDREKFGSAADLVNRLSEEELADILRNFGEERYARRISRSIVNERRKSPIETTTRLRDAVVRALPFNAKRGRINPATRTFQALRIAVNDELASLTAALEGIPSILGSSGRACVISFHSLEDRIVKRAFRKFSDEGLMRPVNKKPIVPGAEKLAANPRIRSAKLRAAERI